jgi:hypothetical protein
LLRASSRFGSSVALRGDTIAIGASDESSAAKGFGGNQDDVSASKAGAVFTFARAAGVFTQRHYVKASNTRANALFGTGVALSADAMAVGASDESSGSTGVNGNENDASAIRAGAA